MGLLEWGAGTFLQTGVWGQQRDHVRVDTMLRFISKPVQEKRKPHTSQKFSKTFERKQALQEYFFKKCIVIRANVVECKCLAILNV